jgi:hypothetical protein
VVPFIVGQLRERGVVGKGPEGDEFEVNAGEDPVADWGEPVEDPEMAD